MALLFMHVHGVAYLSGQPAYMQHMFETKQDNG